MFNNKYCEHGKIRNKEFLIKSFSYYVKVSYGTFTLLTSIMLITKI